MCARVSPGGRAAHAHTSLAAVPPPLPPPHHAFWGLGLGTALDAGGWVGSIGLVILQPCSTAPTCPSLPLASPSHPPAPAGWIERLDKAGFFSAPHLCAYLPVIPCQFRRCLQKPQALFSVVDAGIAGRAQAGRSHRDARLPAGAWCPRGPWRTRAWGAADQTASQPQMERSARRGPRGV